MRNHVRNRSLLLMTVLALGSVFLAPTSNAANVAQGKPAFADVNMDVQNNVTDGDLATQWTTNNSPAAPSDWIAIDLGSPQSIKFLRIFWAANAAPSGFTVDVATNAVTDPADFNYGNGDWVTKYERYPDICDGTTAPPQPPSPELIDLTSLGLNARYIRIFGINGPNPCADPAVINWAVNEFQVLDAPLPKITGTTVFNGAGVQGALVTLSGPAGTSMQKTAAGGTFSFIGLDPGAYTLRAWAPGRYAPVTQAVNVTTTDVTQDLTFTTAVVNSTAPLPAYGLDFIASAANPTNMNAAVAPLAIPAESLPPGEQVWNTSTALPGAATTGPDLPSTLKFFIPPTADGKNNVLSALNVTVPFAPANYTAVYFLQTALEGNYYTTAILHYQDGTSELATTSSGSTLYGIQRGDNGTSPGNPGEDEVVAMTFSEMYTGEAFTTTRGWNVYLHPIKVDPTKVLVSIEFDDVQAGAGSNTLSKGCLLYTSRCV